MYKGEGGGGGRERAQWRMLCGCTWRCIANEWGLLGASDGALLNLSDVVPTCWLGFDTGVFRHFNGYATPCPSDEGTI